jgi:hypothetical protein
MAPSAVEMIGKKKRSRGKKEEASSSVAAPGACELKQRKRRAQRSQCQVHAFFSLSFKLQLVYLCRLDLLFACVS